MKKFPRRTSPRRSLPRTVIMSRRGGGAANGSGSALGDQSVYVASVPNGKADLLLGFVGGVAQTLSAAGPRGLELFNYAPGPSGAFTGGFGWDGVGALVLPYSRQVAGETFETYGLGGVGQAALTDGTGWSGAAALSTPHVRVVGEDTFETYEPGAVTGDDLTGGTDWNGSAVLHAY